MSKIKDENYFQITGWMLNNLKLKGISLEVFAIIYGFSQDGESDFRGSISYLCDFTGTSRPTVIKALKDLVSSGYLIKTETDINGVKFNKYKANLQVVKNFNIGSKETLQEGSKETLPNNKDINNTTDTDIKKERKKKTSYDAIINEKIDDAELKELMYGFIKMRNLKKRPLTDLALTRAINKLQKLSNDIEEQKEIVGKSIDKCWDEFYELKKEQGKVVRDVSTNPKRSGEEYAEFG